MAEEKKQEEQKEEAPKESAAAEAKADKETKEETKEEKSPETEEKNDKSSDEEEEIDVPEKFKDLVSKIEEMSVLDLAELVKILEKKFGVSAAAPTAMMAAGPAAEGGAAEEQTEFDVEITEAGSNKISVIKAIRAASDLGLKEAKELVDAAPKVFKEGLDKEEAEKLKAALEEAGAKVTLK